MYNEILESANDLIADLKRLESNPSEENFLNANATMATLEEILKPIARKTEILQELEYFGAVETGAQRLNR